VTYRSDEERFYDYIEQLESCIVEDLITGCWIWTGLLWTNGYPRLRRHRCMPGTSSRVHVLIYLWYLGPISEGLMVCHSCDVKRCVNPDHLWLGTNRDNQMDASRKGVFKRYWTPEQRRAWGKLKSGSGNPMYGRDGPLSPAYGRTGSKHPMFGRHHTEEARRRISSSCKNTYENRSEESRKALHESLKKCWTPERRQSASKRVRLYWKRWRLLNRAK